MLTHKNMYAIGIKNWRKSKNGDTMYWTLELIDDDVNYYTTYICSEYRNFSQWRDVIRAVQNNKVAWLDGLWKFKDAHTVNADSKPCIREFFMREQAMQVFYDKMKQTA